jgi:hypothetical protein
MKKNITPKYIIALAHLLKGPINGLEALSLYGDTCLNTTISMLTHQHGMSFKKVLEPHRNRAGGTVYFKRYWLKDEHNDQALRLVKARIPDFTFRL